MSPKQKQESHTLLKGHQLLLLTSFPCLKHRFSQFLLLWLPVVHLLQIDRCGQLLPTLLPPSVPSQELSRTLLLETGQGVLELRMSAARGVASSKNSQGVRAALPLPPSDQEVGNSRILPKCTCIYQYSRLRKPHLYFLAG